MGSLNNLIPYCTIGALLLATIYHTSLYYFRKEQLLGNYSIYLWACFTAILITVIMSPKQSLPDPTKDFYADSAVWFALILYIRFVASAVAIEKKTTYFFWMAIRAGYVLIVLYIILTGIDNFFIIQGLKRLNDLFLNLLNFYSVVVNAYFLILLYRKRKNKFDKLILSGAITLAVFSVLALAAESNPKTDYQFLDLTSFSWLCIGFFTEIVFFSAAMGYRLREDLQQKVIANEKIMQLQKLLLANELEMKKDLMVTRNAEKMIVTKDMHDELSNALVVLKFKVADLRRVATSERESNSLAMLEKEIGNVYDSARTFMHKLFDGFGEQNFDLPDFLNTLSKQFSKSSLRINISVNNEDVYAMLNARQQNSLYFVIKESISNIIKYAEASEVNISIEFVNDDCILLINDNGKGFSTEYKRGIGLQSIRERVEAIHGKLDISSSDSSGTSITVIFPIQKSSMVNISA